MTLEENIQKVRASLDEACRKAGRKPEEVKLVAVSKTVEAPKVAEACKAGLKVFGENRVQELLQKKKELAPHLNPPPAERGEGRRGEDIEWHLIGSLQTNKVKQIVGEVALIHSLDRSELAKEIEKQAEKKNISVDCLIQVNSSGEESKQGFEPGEVESFVAGFNFKRIKIRGLMTIGPLSSDEGKVRASFRSVKNLQQELKKKFPDKDWNILSMGMSGDYAIAIQEGSTLVRIGTAIFGERSKN